jgi:hypothetical protein
MAQSRRIFSLAIFAAALALAPRVHAHVQRRRPGGKRGFVHDDSLRPARPGELRIKKGGNAVAQSKLALIVKTLLAVTATCLLAPQHLRAQQLQPATCADWAAQSWSGTIMISGSGQSTTADGRTFMTSQSATFDVTTTTGFIGCSNFPTAGAWDALQSTASSVTVHDKMIQPSVDSKSNPCTITTSFDFSNNGTFSSPNAGVTIAANFTSNTSGTYKLLDGFNVDGFTITVNASSCGGSVQTSTSQESLGAFVPIFPQLPLPGMIGPLSGSNSIQAPSAILSSQGDPNADSSWTVSWNLAPVPPDLDVIVTIPGYDTWRPTAGKNETDIAGNLLTIQAQLVKKSTLQTAVGIVPEKWSFNLVKVSNEPGVAMNWPSVQDRIDPLNSPPDMTFNKQINLAINPILTISNNDRLGEINNPSQTPNPQQAAVTLVPFDWGGWATLNVTATVFGVPIKGHLQLPNGQNVRDIPLPLRQPGSNIADIWKTQNNVPLSTPDSDDSEVDPQGRSDCVGDGFTLYEEYRGFMENGKHIEGDPHNKDFFILNEIGADAEPGIFLFTALTGLTVHKDIQRNEVETTPRPILKVDGVPIEGNPLINFNVGQGAFEVQQHGVLLITCDGFDGGQTLWPNAGQTVGNQVFAADHAQPGITDLICMQERDAPGTINPGNTHAGSITPINALLQYDVSVAHELLHSVGVLHHGDRDDEGSRSFTLLFPNDPRNTTGQPVLQLAGQNVLVLDEQSGQDQAVNLWNGLLALAQRCDALKANPGAFPPSLADTCANFKIALTNPLTGQLDTFWDESLWVGEPQGKHSGNDQCVMRYPFANAYPSVAPLVGVPVFYTVPAGTEPLGFSLCASPAGTGVNDPNRTLPTGHPQPRYFDARSGRGACKTWICVNDVHSPAADSQ